jgi:hypothetical protein
MIGLFLIPEIVQSEIDWTIVKQIDLNAQPIDVAASEDGGLIFVLTLGEIVVYSSSKNEIENRIPVDKEFDRITYSGKNNTLALISSSSRTLKIIRIDQIYAIDISGLPFKGPANAPVTIAVFDDYQ